MMDNHNYNHTTLNKDGDPRAKSNRYSKGGRAKFDVNQFDFALTQFLIDDNYVGEPPSVQVSIENLNDNIDENFLKKDLTRLGKIRTLEIIRHPRTNQHLGLAKVQFEEISVAQACVDNFNGKYLMGRQLNVFKDLRFAIIEQMKEAKLNPRPTPVQKQPTLPIATLPAPSLPNANLHHPHMNPHQPIIPLHHPHMQKLNSTGPIPSPLSLDYPITTPSSLVSSTATPESITSRQRLDDRIAILMKQPNCVLSTIVAPAAPQASPTYSAFSLTETSYDYAHGSYYHSQTSAPLKALDKQRADLNDHRRPDSNNHSNHHQNHKESYHNKYDRVNNKSGRYSEQNSDEDYIKLPEKVNEPLNVELTEKQIEEEVLPFCYDRFYEELSKNLLTTIFKKLREKHGYQCLEKAQTAFRARQDKIKAQKDKERIEIEQQKLYERRYMPARVEPATEAPRQRVNLIRQRTSDNSLMQDSRRRGEADLRRVNRSSAYVAEPERRGSHNTSIDSDFSDSDSSSSALSSSSGSVSGSSSPTSSSRSSSPSSSRSDTPFSQSSDDFDLVSVERTKVVKNDPDSNIESLNNASRLAVSSPDESKAATNSKTKNEQIAVDALLHMASATGDNKQRGDGAKNNVLTFDDDEEEIVKRPPKSAGRKRKKKTTEVIGVAPEYRPAKRFASDPSGALGPYDENIENTMIDDENLHEEKPEARFMYQQRTEDEKKSMLDDLYGTLTEEDLKYLSQVHLNEGYVGENQDVKIPFGSDYANKVHLNMRRKHMIESKSADSNWWHGCTRCDVIQKGSKEKVNTEENYEDLIKAPIKSHVIQAANSSRRDQRGDQRRIAVLNANLDPDYIKAYTTVPSTLQMRAKNLRFSRSKIHKWGLFACERIGSGDAVIEYVGERIRPSLADHREKIVYANLKAHDGSSYFFRVDSDVIDATLKGNKARFINHCCNPNCIAKVIKNDNGSDSIVIYAKQCIQEDEEITYDYKFPREEKANAIVCNCKAPYCSGYLNYKKSSKNEDADSPTVASSKS